jgi:hypothetical protein
MLYMYIVQRIHCVLILDRGSSGSETAHSINNMYIEQNANVIKNYLATITSPTFPKFRKSLSNPFIKNSDHIIEVMNIFLYNNLT